MNEYPKYLSNTRREQVLVHNEDEEAEAMSAGFSEPPSSNPDLVLVKAFEAVEYPKFVFKLDAGTGKVQSKLVSTEAEGVAADAEGWVDERSGVRSAKPAAKAAKPAAARPAPKAKAALVADDHDADLGVDDDDDDADGGDEALEMLGAVPPIAPFTPPAEAAKPTRARTAPKAKAAAAPKKGSGSAKGAGKGK